jgi:hypothetical protein
MRLRPATLIVPIVAAVVISMGVAATAESSDGSRPPSGEKEFEGLWTVPQRTVEPGVTAAELWTEARDTLACYEAADVGTYGPYPKADGTGVEYSFDATPAAERVDYECSADMMAMGWAFTQEGSRSEIAKLKDLRQRLMECVGGEGVTVPADSAVDKNVPNAGMQSAADRNADAFAACADQLDP